MSRIVAGFSRALAAEPAAEELAGRLEAQLPTDAEIAGALILATAAAGRQGFEIGGILAERWPAASLLGTSFEGLVAEGRAWREEPAIVAIAWTGGEAEPVPILVDSEAFAGEPHAIDHFEHALEEIASGLAREDLLLVFPDAAGATDVEAVLTRVITRVGCPQVVGAAASGAEGGPCRAWADGSEEPGASVALYLPGCSGAGAQLAQAVGTRFASPWLEVSACRGAWLDRIEGEPATDWTRRQLGLEASDPIEPNLDRVLIRVRDAPRRVDPAERVDGLPTAEHELDYVERYVVGVAGEQGAIALAGPVSTGDRVAFALPDPDRARQALREAVAGLVGSQLVFHLACRARDESLHGDPDLESALVAVAAEGREAIGTIAPFQLSPDSLGRPRIQVHRTILVAVGEV